MDQRMEQIEKCEDLELVKVRFALINKNVKRKTLILEELVQEMKRKKVSLLFKANYNSCDQSDCYWYSLDEDTLINFQKTVNNKYPWILTVKLKNNFIMIGQFMEYNNLEKKLLIKLILMINQNKIKMEAQINIDKKGKISGTVNEIETNRKIIGLRQEAEEVMITRYNSKDTKKIYKIQNSKENIILMKNRTLQNDNLGGAIKIIVLEIEVIREVRVGKRPKSIQEVIDKKISNDHKEERNEGSMRSMEKMNKELFKNIDIGRNVMENRFSNIQKKIIKESSLDLQDIFEGGKRESLGISINSKMDYYEKYLNIKIDEEGKQVEPGKTLFSKMYAKMKEKLEYKNIENKINFKKKIMQEEEELQEIWGVEKTYLKRKNEDDELIVEDYRKKINEEYKKQVRYGKGDSDVTNRIILKMKVLIKKEKEEKARRNENG